MSNEDDHAVSVAKAIVEKHCRSVMGADACIVDNPKRLFSDIAEAVNTYTNSPARTATPLTPGYHRGYQEGFNEGIKQAQKFVESQSSPPPIIINRNDQLVAALREMLEIVEDEGHAGSYVPQIAAARATLATEQKGDD